MEQINIFTDGGSRGNPGQSACAFVCSNGVSVGKYLGFGTNNEAEYQGVIIALSYLLSLENLSKVNFYADSQLVVNQINGLWKIKEDRLKSLNSQVQDLVKRLREMNTNLRINYSYIPREKNKEADLLVNQTLDEHSVIS